MTDLIKKTIKICNIEFFHCIRNKFLISALFFLFILGLQFGDITMRVGSNFFVTTWISINVYFVFALFGKNNREYLLQCSSLSSNHRLLLLFAVSGIMNLGWGILIFFQLIIVMEAYFVNAVMVTALQFFFAVALGALSGNLHKWHLGITIIISLAIINFIFYNPLIYDGSSHFFSISEQLYAINQPNLINYLSILLLTLSSILAVKILSQSNRKKKTMKVMILMSSYITSFILLVCYEFISHERYHEEEVATITRAAHMLRYRNLPIDKVESMYLILSKFEEYYRDLNKGTEYNTYVFNKEYLSPIGWRIKGDEPKSIYFEDKTIHVDVLSDSMIYFDNADLLRNFIDEIKYSFVEEIYGSGNSRYIRHLIEGYSIAILRDLSSELKEKKYHEVQDYYVKEIEKIFSVPTTEYNYVYRVALIIYDKYPESVGDVYDLIVEKNPESNQQFIGLLNKNFPDIVKDYQMKEILKHVTND